jgi:hypothetical protein
MVVAALRDVGVEKVSGSAVPGSEKRVRLDNSVVAPDALPRRALGTDNAWAGEEG